MRTTVNMPSLEHATFWPFTRVCDRVSCHSINAHVLIEEHTMGLLLNQVVAHLHFLTQMKRHTAPLALVRACACLCRWHQKPIFRCQLNHWTMSRVNGHCHNYVVLLHVTNAANSCFSSRTFSFFRKLTVWFTLRLTGAGSRDCPRPSKHSSWLYAISA